MDVTNDSSNIRTSAAAQPTSLVAGSAGADAKGAASPLLLTMAEASAQLRISKWMLYRLIQTRQLKTVTIGRRRFVPPSSLQTFVERLSHEEAI